MELGCEMSRTPSETVSERAGRGRDGVEERAAFVEIDVALLDDGIPVVHLGFDRDDLGALLLLQVLARDPQAELDLVLRAPGLRGHLETAAVRELEREQRAGGATLRLRVGDRVVARVAERQALELALDRGELVVDGRLRAGVGLARPLDLQDADRDLGVAGAERM